MSMLAFALLLGVSLQGNIPKDRLDGVTYTSPDGSYQLAVPPLVTPGAKAEERQIGPGEAGVFFMDDLGTMYYVIRSDNRTAKQDLEKLAASLTINDVIREKQIISTARGSELRLAAYQPGASPMLAETKVKKKTVQTKLDFFKAESLFLSGDDMYDVCAAVSGKPEDSVDQKLALAKERLQILLDGLRIKPATP